ncbi:hypothetical protein JVT61DRAFT_11756 [Boletus reticuloceps]|uniref:F-box domain-containing protein n=1 Tax=Boletus reticuloceps TaxID=495285 RepID=A0A8I2YVS5_9AGAM|nr:hypothetical protein JVT61DRAFT_11756 [Boletus reticuloceps]
MLEDHHARFPNNPFVPPTGDICFVNNLPLELLCRIFETGLSYDASEDEKEYLDNIRRELDAKETPASDIENDDEDEGDEEESDGDEGDCDEAGSSDSRSPRPPFPIVVSHVCRHWRSVAFATLSLWAKIVVTSGASPPYELVSTQLERSKDSPLDIFINCEPRECEDRVEEPSEQDVIFLFSLLTPHIHRWRSIKLYVSDYDYMKLFFSAVSDPCISTVPQLTTLGLYYRDQSDGYGDLSMSKDPTLFASWTPLLTRVVLWGVHVDWDQPWIASASGLTDLELAYHPEDIRPSWARFATILRGAPTLKRLSLRQSGPSGDPPDWFIEPTPGSRTDPNAPLQLSRVTDFVLAFHSQKRAIGLLRKLYLPALKSLVLHFDKGNYTDLVHELVGPATCLYPARERPRSLLSRLESLIIAGLPCRTGCFKLLCSELQNLRSLHLSSWCLSILFMDILRAGSGCGDIPLPQLVTLYVAGGSGSALRDVVQKRRDAGVPLTSLYVGYSCELRHEDVRWLRENMKTFRFFTFV